MRAVTLILLVVGLLIGGFVGYWMLQPPGVATAPRVAPSRGEPGEAELGFDDNGMPLGAGQNVWVKSYSKEGELTSEFTAVRYEPQKDGTVLVDRPQARFYLRDGQYLLLTGDSGVVTIEQASRRDRNANMLGGQRMQPPSRGELHGVNIFLYDTLEAPNPALTVELNNVAFDNETFRIYTEQYTIDQRTVPPDQVPVRVYGEDFEFYGRGLTIRWDELKRRLDLLEVAHGEKLIVRNPGRLGERFRTRRSEESTAWREPMPRSAQAALASADPRSVSEALPAPAAPVTRPAPQAYRAVFFEAVRVEQQGMIVAAGDLLEIDLTLTGQRATATSSPATPSPASAPVSAPAEPSPAQASGIAGAQTTQATVPTPQALPSTQPSPSLAQGATSTTQASPTTEPDGSSLTGLTQPVTVYWTGPLRVTPLEQGAPPPGQSIVSMVGSPLVLSQPIGRIIGTRLRYDTAAGRAVVDGSEAVPVVLQDERGMHIQTESLEHQQLEQVAVLRGRSAAVLPLADGTEQTELHAAWDQACVLQMASSSGGQMSIRHAQLEGDVSIEHPRMDLKAGTLALDFVTETPASTQPATVPSTQPATNPSTRPSTRAVPSSQPAILLERAVAHGDVRVRFKDQDGRDQRVSADALDLAMARDAGGALYPRIVRAEGNVSAQMGEQSFSGGRVEMTLAPTTRPAGKDELTGGEVQVQELTALGDVRVQTPDASVHAEQAQIRTLESGRRITFLGQPSATLRTEQATLTGPIVVLEPEAHRAEVRGPGSLQAMQTESGGEARPVDVTWENGAVLDARANQGVITGNVVVKTIDRDGIQQVAGGHRLLLSLQDIPATQPATAPATKSATLPASRPTSRPAPASPEMDFLAGKRIDAITLVDGVALRAHELDKGQVVRGLSLETGRLSYHVTDERLVIPQAGRMLYEDHRSPAPATTAPTTVPEAEPAVGDFSKLRGLTAIAWEKQLVFDQSAHSVTLDGDVRVVHEPEGSPGNRLELRADRIVLELEPAKPAATTQPATGPVQQRTSVASIRSEGSVYFKAQRLEFRAASVVVDPQRHLLIARGTESQPAELVESDGASRGQFGELWLDTRTQQVLKLTDMQGQVRR